MISKIKVSWVQVNEEIKKWVGRGDVCLYNSQGVNNLEERKNRDAKT